MGIVVTGVCGALAYWGKTNYRRIRGQFDQEFRRQAARIVGKKWRGTETFSHDGTTNEYDMTFRIRGYDVIGKQKCIRGFDPGREFHSVGRFQDGVLRMTWVPSNRDAVESGAFALKLIKEGLLEGCGLYVEPEVQAIRTSTIKATR